MAIALGNVLLETAEGASSSAEAFAARRIEDELSHAAERAAGLFEKNAA